MTIDYFLIDCSICDRQMRVEAKFPLTLGKVECPACWLSDQWKERNDAGRTKQETRTASQES